MKLSEPIVIRPLWWVLLDVAALLLVASGFFLIYAVSSGAWNPLGSVTIGYWPILLFATWVAIATAVILLTAYQLACREGAHTVVQTVAEESPQAAPEPEVAAPQRTDVAAHEEGAEQRVTAASGRGAEREEIAPVGAGR